MAVEDEQIFLLIDAAAAAVNPVTLATDGYLSRESLTMAFGEVEKHDLVVTKIVMNAQAFKSIRTWGQNEFDPIEVMA